MAKATKLAFWQAAAPPPVVDTGMPRLADDTRTEQDGSPTHAAASEAAAVAELQLLVLVPYWATSMAEMSAPGGQPASVSADPALAVAKWAAMALAEADGVTEGEAVGVGVGEVEAACDVDATVVGSGDVLSVTNAQETAANR